MPYTCKELVIHCDGNKISFGNLVCDLFFDLSPYTISCACDFSAFYVVQAKGVHEAEDISIIQYQRPYLGVP